jgi:predicted Rossmann fold nucleotide-binding protein DprA/Smf involved in DNA uptake
MSLPTLSLEFLAYCLQQAPGIGPATLRSILRRMEQEQCDPEQFLNLAPLTLQGRYGLKPEALALLHQPEVKTLANWQTLQDRGVKVLVMGRPKYPTRLLRTLGRTAPPLLYIAGDTSLFEMPSAGFCGSRKASDKGLQISDACARLLAQTQVNVVSGYAHGVDLAAHQGALLAGGTTTIVLAEGILHFRVKDSLPAGSGDEFPPRVLVVSEFPPGLPWKAHNAMTRNHTICGLSHAVVIIESGLDGGTFEAGKTALDLNLPLFCVEYGDAATTAPGNAYFLQNGAGAIRRGADRRPNLTHLLAAVHGASTAETADSPEPLLALQKDSASYTG